MQAAINQFRINIDYVRHLGTIYKALRSQTTVALDLSDILRAQLVMAVSVLDYYIHEIVRLGMLEIYHGHRIQTEAFSRFQIVLSGALQCISNPTSDDWLEDQIRNRHSFQSFQQPDKIADAIRLISDVELWKEVAKHLGKTSDDVKQQLTLIVNRRNQIAHEADIDPSFGTRWPIDEILVNESVGFIEQLAETIYKVL